MTITNTSTVGLRSDDVELSSLDPLDRVLLASDGTLTEMLEALYLETLSLITLGQEIYPARGDIESLELAAGENVLERRVLLRGRQSGRGYIYADSLVAVDRLAAAIRRALLTSDVPLGQLWKRCGTELFKQVIERRRQPAAELFAYFHVRPESLLLVRTYCAHAGGSPVALIREHILPPSMRRRTA